jgi:hypothetical protein
LFSFNGKPQATAFASRVNTVAYGLPLNDLDAESVFTEAVQIHAGPNAQTLDKAMKSALLPVPLEKIRRIYHDLLLGSIESVMAGSPSAETTFFAPPRECRFEWLGTADPRRESIAD